MFIAFLCPEISKIKNYLRNLTNYLLNITHFYDNKYFRKSFYQNNFSSFFIGTVWHLFSNFEIKRPKKCFFEYFTQHWMNSKKWTPKNHKFKNPSTTQKFYVDLGPKRYLGRRDPIIGSVGYGGGGLK